MSNTSTTITPKKKKSSGSNGKFTYLVTYSKADMLKCNSRLQFATMVCETFNQKDDEDYVVSHWVCCVENHAREGVHFHLAIKLHKRRRFALIAQSLREKYKINVHFQEWVSFYYDAYEYVCKQDENSLKSPGHPPLSNSPVTRKAVVKRKSVGEGTASTDGPMDTPKTTRADTKPKRRRRLDTQEVYNIVVNKYGVRNDLDLCSLAKVQYDEGKFDLHHYVINTAEISRIDMLKTCWKVHTSKEVLQRNSKSRLEILSDAAAAPTHAVENCQWLKAALEVLELNGIHACDFTSAVKRNLELGRGKGRNILIHGEGDRAKSFLLMPLLKIFSTFMCPAQNKFNWVNAWDREVIFFK